MKKMVLAVIISSIVIIQLNCDDSSVSTPQNTQLCVSGQVSNWTYGSNKTVQAKILSETHNNYIVASTTIDAQGNFNICLPATVSDTSLYVGDSIFTTGCSKINVNFNPPDTKGTQVWNFMVYSSDSLMGYLKKNNYSVISAGAYSLIYIYVNKNVTVSGWEYCFPGDTSRFDGTAISGWNKIVKNCIRADTASRTYLYNTTEPSGGVWKFVSY